MELIIMVKIVIGQIMQFLLFFILYDILIN